MLSVTLTIQQLMVELLIYDEPKGLGNKRYSLMEDTTIPAFTFFIITHVTPTNALFYNS